MIVKYGIWCVAQGTYKGYQTAWLINPKDPARIWEFNTKEEAEKVLTMCERTPMRDPNVRISFSIMPIEMIC